MTRSFVTNETVLYNTVTLSSNIYAILNDHENKELIFTNKKVFISFSKHYFLKQKVSKKLETFEN